MKRYPAISVIVLILSCAGGCFGPPRPPLVDLLPFGTIGFVSFETNAKGNLAEYATRIFLEDINRSQPAVRIKELGTAGDVLKDVGASRMTPDAIAAIGRTHDVAAVMMGDLKVSDIKPRISLAIIVNVLDVSADVTAVLAARIVDTKDGSNLWSVSAQSRQSVAHLSAFRSGDFLFDAKDPEAAYGELVRSLTRRATQDFRWR
jgi:nitrogen regulatory protein PII